MAWVRVYIHPSFLRDLFYNSSSLTAQKMKLSIKVFFSKCNTLMENFIFCAVPFQKFDKTLPHFTRDLLNYFGTEFAFNGNLSAYVND